MYRKGVINISKYLLRGYGDYGGTWSKGETKEEAVRRLVGEGLQLNSIELFTVPDEAEITVFNSGRIRFSGIDEEDMEKEELTPEEVEEINNRIE